MDLAAIEEAATRVQREIWQRRIALCGREIHPFEALEPELASKVLGVTLEYVEQLRFTIEDSRYETAGLLDRTQKKILIATRFGEKAQRFTAGHELGHWEIHPGQMKVHHDRPIYGLEPSERAPRPSVEREADYFSACFLMPRKLVSTLFHQMFATGGKPFVFDETTLFNLPPAKDRDALLYPDIDSYERETFLARARYFGRRGFEKSLAEMFGVSTATMAIRLRELQLVRAWP